MNLAPNILALVRRNTRIVCESRFSARHLVGLRFPEYPERTFEMQGLDSVRLAPRDVTRILDSFWPAINKRQLLI